jgi:uncharacterized membrane protein YcaP (DUF421 family)
MHDWYVACWCCGMASNLPQPPSIQPGLRISIEQLVALLLFGSVITAGIITEPADALQVAGRVALIYGFLTAAFRLMGKRELSTLSPLELITLMLIPEIAASTLNDEAPVLHALVGVSVLLSLVFLMSLLTTRFRAIERLVDPPARVLVVDGQLCREALLTERITPDELFAEMHKHGIAELADVQWAILEGGGDIAFISKRRPHVDDVPKRKLVG